MARSKSASAPAVSPCAWRSASVMVDDRGEASGSQLERPIEIRDRVRQIRALDTRDNPVMKRLRKSARGQHRQGVARGTAVAVGLGVTRVEGEGSIEASDRADQVTLRLQGHTAVVMGLGVKRVDRDGAIEICESAGRLALCVSQHAAVAMRLRVSRVNGDRSVEVGECANEVAAQLTGKAPVIIRGCATRVDRDGLIEIGDGTEQVALQVPCRATIEIKAQPNLRARILILTNRSPAAALKSIFSLDWETA